MYDKKDGKRPEAVHWRTMDPATELELRLDDFANECLDFHPDKLILFSQSTWVIMALENSALVQSW